VDEENTKTLDEGLESSDEEPASSDKDSETLSFSEYWDSQLEEDTEEETEDNRADSSERTIVRGRLLFSDSLATRYGESSGNAGTQSASGVRSDARNIRPTGDIEEDETLKSKEAFHQLSEKLACAEARIAVLESEVEELRARK